MTLPLGKVILKPGRERSVRSRHPWIFSGAIASLDLPHNGACATVLDSSGTVVGCGYFNSTASIAGRMLTFTKENPIDALAKAFDNAVALRRRMIPESVTGVRLINGEGDGIPGLIIDRYDSTIVLQSGTLGIDLLREYLIELIKEKFQPQTIFERSALPSRKEEQLGSVSELRYGIAPQDVEFSEYGCRFRVDVIGGQKTGFFLDQREMRAFIGSIAMNRSVLNCFSYTGGFSVHALRGGAKQVHSVDLSAPALALAEQNVLLNDVDSSRHRVVLGDVFELLREDSAHYDIVVLDPPAFAKNRSHVDRAVRGYRDINLHGIARVAPGGILVTSSCSHFISPELFQRVVFEAAREAGRAVQILSRHRHAIDHPINLFHPEGEYLKSLILRVD